MRVAAAPKASRFVRREQHGTLAIDPGDEQRPDTRERFYDAPVEHLKALHPCFRCFDALMHHFRGTYVPLDTLIVLLYFLMPKKR